MACQNLRLLEALSSGECHDIHLVSKTKTSFLPQHDMQRYLKVVAEYSGASKGNMKSSLLRHTTPHFPQTQEKIMSIACFADETPVYHHLEKSWPNITLKGEIHLSSSLLPSSTFIPYSVQVSQFECHLTYH